VPRYVSFPEIPETERWIGQRLRDARREFRISQARLAPLIDLTRDQLNNVELGRVALRLHNGWEACRELDLNPGWLQSGWGEQFGFADISFGYQISRETLFSELPFSDDDNPDGYQSVRHAVLLGKTARKTLSADEILGRWLNKVPMGKMPEFSAAIDEAARSFFQLHRRHVKARLTTPLLASTSPDMTWPELRLKLKSLTDKRGGKSALARKARVSRQVLNAWLSDRAKPNAIATLFLLSWVKAEEAKQRESARTSAEARAPKTRRKSDNE
jgi:DNA-binding XRE family transcriptional regulator